MSTEEIKIRNELEMDVERELEEEIKNGICRLAHRLHRLYKQQKERNSRELSDLGMKDLKGTKSKIFSEVNINIKMEGETSIEIKEIKKKACENRARIIPKAGNTQGMAAHNSKKFNWVNSLRSGTNSLSVGHKIDISSQSRLRVNRAKNDLNASQQRKMNMGVNSKILELGWKD